MAHLNITEFEFECTRMALLGFVDATVCLGPSLRGSDRGRKVGEVSGNKNVAGTDQRGDTELREGLGCTQ